MITVDAKLKKEIKECEGDTTRLTAYLMKSYNVFDIAESLAMSLINNGTAPAKITLSIEDFFTHFKLRGLREDGTIENRGQYNEETAKYLQAYSDFLKAVKNAEK